MVNGDDLLLATPSSRSGRRLGGSLTDTLVCTAQHLQAVGKDINKERCNRDRSCLKLSVKGTWKHRMVRRVGSSGPSPAAP